MNRRQWLILASRAGCAALLPGCAQSVAREGINPAAVARMGGDGYGIWQGGRWLAGHGPGTRMPSLSITKFLTALAVVRATGEGWLELDRPLGETLPEWKSDSGKRRVTVRMLVNQTAGFASGERALYHGQIADKGKTAIALPLVDPPGTQFRYGPASAEILGEILRRKLRDRGDSTENFLRDLMGQLGVSSPGWRKDQKGNLYLSTGAEFSVRDLGKLGQVAAQLANGTNAAGLQAEVFRDLATPRAANPMVAAGIWWNRNAAKSDAFAIEPERHLEVVQPPSFWAHACLGVGLDPGWFALVGSGGKRVYVLPSREWVVARLDHANSWNDAAFLRALTA